MSDRRNIYELLEQIHMEAFPHATFGEFMAELDRLVGPFNTMSDGEMVTRLSGYLKSPFHWK